MLIDQPSQFVQDVTTLYRTRIDWRPAHDVEGRYRELDRFMNEYTRPLGSGVRERSK